MDIFQSPVDASLARRFGFALLEKGAESVNLKSFSYYGRMLPAQDHIQDGGTGNRRGRRWQLSMIMWTDISRTLIVCI